MLIAAFDLASTCGWAQATLDDLRPGSKPLSGSHRFAPPRSPPDDVLGAAGMWFEERFARKPKPDYAVIEVPGYHGFLKRKGRPTSSVEVMDLLVGLSGVVREHANRAGIKTLRCSASDARGVFLGSRRMKGEDAKPAAFDKCVALGWAPSSQDASDALAVLVYAFEKLMPGSTESTLPIFLGGKPFARAR